MTRLGNLHCFVLTLLLLCLFADNRDSLGQDLSEKLSAKAEFVPSAITIKDQLIEAAQHYDLPMGIEWVDLASETPRPVTLSAQASVKALLDLILTQSPNHRMRIEDGVVNIYQVSFSADSRDFLNLSIPEYRIRNANVFGALFDLKLDIHRTLHPEVYKNGWAGGFGYGVDRTDGFDVKNISISERNVSVRTILNKIVEINRNAIWVVTLFPARMMPNEDFYAGTASDGKVFDDFAWQVIPIDPNKLSK